MDWELHLHVKRLTQNINWRLAGELKPPKKHKTLDITGRTKEKKTERKGIRMGLTFLRGSCEGEKEHTSWEAT